MYSVCLALINQFGWWLLMVVGFLLGGGGGGEPFVNTYPLVSTTKETVQFWEVKLIEREVQ